MGVLFKSAVGLGAVYFAMFAPALKSDEAVGTASLCASAARLQLAGDAALRANLSAAGCAFGVSAQARKLVAPAAPARASGALTEADMQEPWFGPPPPARKSPRQG